MLGRSAAWLIEMAAHASALTQESHHETLRGSAWAVMGSVGLCARAHGMQEGLPTFPSLAIVGLSHITNKTSIQIQILSSFYDHTILYSDTMLVIILNW